MREAVEWDNLDLEVYTIRNEDTRVISFVEFLLNIVLFSSFYSYIV